MLLVNPFTGKLVDASDGECVNQLLRAGFKEQEPEVAAPAEADAAPAPRKRGRPPKTG